MRLLHYKTNSTDAAQQASVLLTEAAPEQEQAYSLEEPGVAGRVGSLRARMNGLLFPNRWILNVAKRGAAQATPQETERLLEFLGRKHSGVSGTYLTAVETLGNLPLSDTQRSRVVAICRKWVNRPMAVHPWQTIRDALFNFLVIAFIAMPVMHWLGFNPSLAVGIVVGSIVGLCGRTFYLPLAWIVEGKRWSRIRIAYAVALRKLGSPEGVAPLLRAARSLQPGLRMAAEDSLEALLTSIDLNTLPPLTTTQQNLMWSLLMRPRERLVLALLDMLEVRGNGDTAWAVKSLIRRTGSDTVRARAKAVLPVLQARRQQTQHADTLLRASSQEAPADTLLRAGVDSATPAEELLRASDTEI
jgi:hypothetical protein